MVLIGGPQEIKYDAYVYTNWTSNSDSGSRHHILYPELAASASTVAKYYKSCDSTYSLTYNS